MSQPPPFVLPPEGWRARLRGLLAGLGVQSRAIGLVALAALALAAFVWFRAQPSGEPPLWSPPEGTLGAGAGAAGGRPEGGAAGLGPSAGDGAAGAGGTGPEGVTPDGAPVAGGPGVPGVPGSVGAPGGTGGRIAVHVAGRVRRPGLVLLPPGSRVADALAAAGGPARDADLDRVNLARQLTDGEQVLVTREGDPAAAPAPPGAPPAGSTAPGGSLPAGPVDLNTATPEQLEALPGVGAVTAERIVAYRTRQPFRSVQDLLQVEGIGERRFETLRPLVTVR